AIRRRASIATSSPSLDPTSAVNVAGLIPRIMPATTDNIRPSEPLTSKEIRETYRTESSGTRESVFVLLFAHKHRFLRRSPPVGWPGATENAKADLEG